MTISVTQAPTEYVVTVNNDSGDNGAWVALYAASTPLENYNSYLDDAHWQFLSGDHVQPGAPITSATLHFPLTPLTDPLEFRFWANRALQASAPVVPPASPSANSTPDGYINVKDHGATGSPSGDDTVAIKAAADACRASYNGWGTKGLYFPPGGVYRFSSPVDFQYISNIACHGWLVWNGGLVGFDSPCIKAGVANAAYPADYYFFGLYCLGDGNSYAELKSSMIQFAGLRNSTVRIGACNSYVEVAAAHGPWQGTAYTEFHLGGTLRLEIHSEPGDGFDKTTGWINSNQFYGGTLAQFRLGANWLEVESVNGLHVKTKQEHGFVTGNLVEMYNGTPAEASFQIVTVIDATHFDLQTPVSANAGNGWRCMGPAGYHHNDNHFFCNDLEDDPAIFHNNNGSYNHFKGNRTEATGKLVFGPDTYGNTYEASNSTHGRLPDPNEFELTIIDHSGGKNFAGWFTRPKTWGT